MDINVDIYLLINKVLEVEKQQLEELKAIRKALELLNRSSNHGD